MQQERLPSNTPFVVRNIAFFGMLGFAVLEVLFIVGEYWTDPGGVEAIVGSIGVIATIVGVSAWAWFSPHTAKYYLWASVGVIVAVGLWWAVAPRFVMDVMDEQGPIIPVAAIIAAVPLVFWGRRDWLVTRRAGAALIVVAIAPILGVAASPEDVARGVLTAVAVMTGPYAIGGLVYALGTLPEDVGISAAKHAAKRGSKRTPQQAQPSSYVT